MPRCGLLILCLVGLGCHSLPEPVRGPDRSPDATALWEEGQSAMRKEQPEAAIRCYEQSLAVDPALSCNYLSLAAACMACGKEEAACANLAKYVEGHPDHVAARAHYAELLFKLKRLPEARSEFERFAAEAQDKGEKPARIIHAFSRLMEIALAEGNEYEEHLYRGIGLLLLARRRAELAEPDGELPVSGLLWKSAGELSLAQELHPREARPCFYLYSVWWAMGKHQPAQRWLRYALDNASFTPLSPAELHGLHLASQCLEKRL